MKGITIGNVIFVINVVIKFVVVFQAAAAKRENDWPAECRTKSRRRATKAATKTTFWRRKKLRRNGKKCRRRTVNKRNFDCDEEKK